MEEQRALVAAKDGDLATLEQLLEAGALGPGIIDTLGAGLVHHATRAGHLACVKFLVQRAKLPGNQRAHNGATPVHDAAATGSLAELCWLVREGGCGLQVSEGQPGGTVSVWLEGGVSREPEGPRPWTLSGTHCANPMVSLCTPSLPLPPPQQHKALASQGCLLNHLCPHHRHREPTRCPPTGAPGLAGGVPSVLTRPEPWGLSRGLGRVHRPVPCALGLRLSDGLVGHFYQGPSLSCSCLSAAPLCGTAVSSDS